MTPNWIIRFGAFGKVENLFVFVVVDDSGRISIWNMAPIVDEKDEEDENVPKMLCLLDNHSGL